MTMKGFETVMKNLNREIKGIEGRTAEGVEEAALFVEREATERAPLLTGNLRGSSYTRRQPTGIGAEVGFEAEYALPVHEIDADYTVGGWKFLQNAIDENRSQIVEIIRLRASI